MDESTDDSLQANSAQSAQYPAADAAGKGKWFGGMSRGFRNLVKSKNDQQPPPAEPMDPAEEQIDESELLDREHWKAQEQKKLADAVFAGEEYIEKPYPGFGANAAGETQIGDGSAPSDSSYMPPENSAGGGTGNDPNEPVDSSELEARERHRQNELKREQQCLEIGQTYVKRHYVDDLMRKNSTMPKADGRLAEVFGTQAYGGNQSNRNTSRVVQDTPAHQTNASAMYPDDNYDAHGIYGSVMGPPPVPQKKASYQETYSRPTRRVSNIDPSKPGWAGIFSGAPNRSEAVNPFAGSFRPPALPMPSQNANLYTSYEVPHSITSALPPEIVERLNKGRELVKLALDNHDKADHLRDRGKLKEANASYRAADAGYHRALEILMPARKELDHGSEQSRPARLKEKESLKKLISSMLDKWESVKPYIGPEVPTDEPGGFSTGDYSDDQDPLLARLQSSVADLGLDAPPAHTSSAFRHPHGKADLGLSMLPSVPDHDIGESDSNLPQQSRMCFMCISSLAEVVTPCRHYLCRSCSESAIYIYGNKCPQCESPCSKADLKQLA